MVTTDDEATSSSAVSKDSLYEEVAVPVSDVEDADRCGQGVRCSGYPLLEAI